ncbi:hypothetical protein [Nocardioides sp.]|uniref:hypothetical protein n=1 Tax=Nocardioides sp. TaxID=35761 RepID=UPI0027367313|nr:hypothetical protein [Nocardioides sp.]MDP3889848.1 hypothetical protein [Nocardioides sp.]
MSRRLAPFERRLTVESVRKASDRRRTAYWCYYLADRCVGTLSLIGSREWGGHVEGYKATGVTHPAPGQRHRDRVGLGRFPDRAAAERAIWTFAQNLPTDQQENDR